MNTRTGLSLILLAAAGPALAQPPAAPPEPGKVIFTDAWVNAKADVPPAATPGGPDELAGSCTVNGTCPPRCWVKAAALCWWVKDGPARFPLVTTGDPADALPGA